MTAGRKSAIAVDEEELMSLTQGARAGLEKCQLPVEFFNEAAGLADQPPAAPSRLRLSPDGETGRVEGTPASAAEPRITKIIHAFNNDVSKALIGMGAAVHASRAGLIPAQDESVLPARARSLLDRYAVVDALALHYRDRTRSTFLGLLVAAFFAMLTFEVFAHYLAEVIPHGSPLRLVFWLYPVLWVAAWLLWLRAHRRGFQRRFQDYRALAEGLRVQFFWNLLGLPDAVEDYYLRKQQGELDWIRRALRFWRDRDEKLMADPPPSTAELSARKELVRRCWIRDQFHYFAEVARPREERKARRCKQWGAILLWLSLVPALGIGVWELLDLAGPAEAAREGGLHHGEIGLIVAIGILLVGAALIVAYGEKMAFAEHTRQYGATSMLFHNADKALSDGPLTSADREVFRNLGKEALQENGDWLLLHRDRPLEVIVP
jgi:hypothetical protein